MNGGHAVSPSMPASHLLVHTHPQQNCPAWLHPLLISLQFPDTSSVVAVRISVKKAKVKSRCILPLGGDARQKQAEGVGGWLAAAKRAKSGANVVMV